ncbi:hypothetical protein [Falsirhodobacter sp. 20TX0035]|uniref:hypothetical protein n=1 Tax=Falsirhodobacter sp. 20TX0035 TaxID=3022019 RepID=UPI00232F56E9|nr:hypothetical protein [Falsirhodobacter sp. 20TX0035]MDB6452218.1 hypothetical protein [Falsirhodobacter sp. 20TX0035]
MPILLILGLIAFFVLSWWWHRSRTLTRDCTWREDRSRAAPGRSFHHCMVCGAETDLPKGEQPRHCLRQQ